MTESVGQVTEKNAIINDPYEEPELHWDFGGPEPLEVPGRRPSGYLPPLVRGGELQITDTVIEIPLVNQIRDRVKQWRTDGYPGAGAVTLDLFDRWFDSEDREAGTRPFFAQQEAMETIAFLTEAPSSLKVGISVPKSESYERWAVKLATGAGKTLVMAMVIAWSGLNKAANRQAKQFADAFLVVCPNLTVKERLAGIEGLLPSHPESAYRHFGLIPGNYSGLFGQVRVMVTNWHALAEQTDPKRGVLRRGRESDSAFCKRVLRPLGDKRRLMVINDEAHHAWRPPPALHLAPEDREEAERATVWLQGLERINRDREILRALDFSATPMYPGAIKEKAWQPFEWVVSDFSLVDAIEAGLVKIPRIPTDDNAGRAVPKYRNLWQYVKASLPRRGEEAGEGHSLVEYLTEVDGPLKQLSGEWERTFKRWEKAGREVPPAMIVVCSDTRMAQVLETHIGERGEAGPALQNADGSQVTVRIDSKLLAEAELREESETAHDAAERIRRVVATVGKPGQPGEQVRCVISVAMLSEGWDARNVTQILGLRAFQSQLLCEQVVGRGLRRTDYTNLGEPEYVDVYGVPFQLLPFAKASSKTPIEPPRTTQVRTLPERAEYRLEFPRVFQILPDVGERLEIDIGSIAPIRVSSEFDPTMTWVSFDPGTSGEGLGEAVQDRQAAYERFRMQRLVFRVAAEVIRPLAKPWLFPQAVRIVEDVIAKRVTFDEGVDPRELSNFRYLGLLRERIIDSIRSSPDGSGALLPVLDEYEPVGSTDHVNFVTAKRCMPTQKSHLSHAVCDSGLEAAIVDGLEGDERVLAYAKNDRLFLEIPYRYGGRTLRYRPDFLVSLGPNRTLLLEGKGHEWAEKEGAKKTAAARWVAAVNSWGKLGRWHHEVCRDVSELPAIIGSGDAAD